MKTLGAHVIFQFRKLLRTPSFWAPTILFPAMFYTFFGASLPPEGLYSQYSIASFCIYGILGVSFYQFGVGLAQDRESQFDAWLKTLPGSALPKTVSQFFTAIIFALLAVGLVLGASQFLAKTNLDVLMTVRLLGVCVLAAIPASLMGISLGYLSSGRAAPAIANLLFLPLAFLGGLWVPPIGLPKTINTISEWTPTRQMAEMAWSAVNGTMPQTRVLVLYAAFTLGFALLAVLLIKRDKDRRFG